MKSLSISIRSVFERGEGFTLIEVIVVTAIFALLGSLGLFIGMDVYRSYSFRSERDIVVSMLEKARSQSMVNLDQSAHGVRIESARYTIFEGASYAGRIAALDEAVDRAPTVLVAGNPPLPLDIVFGQLDGNVQNAGAVTISDGARSELITINHEGRIDW